VVGGAKSSFSALSYSVKEGVNKVDNNGQTLLANYDIIIDINHSINVIHESHAWREFT